jgi:putative phosphoribosyl transferase
MGDGSPGLLAARLELPGTRLAEPSRTGPKGVAMWPKRPIYRNRAEAGERLAALLLPYRGERPVVLAAPRGGVPVGAVVASRLDAPLDVVLARKLPVPGNPELGFGAVAESGALVLNEEVIQIAGIGSDEIEAIVAEVRREVAERARRYRQARPPIGLEDRTAILVDDGLATGVTMEACVLEARSRRARRVVAAAPVSSTEAASRVGRQADDFVCPLVEPVFVAVGAYYLDFPQLTDDDVVRLLEAARRRAGEATPSPPPPP